MATTSIDAQEIGRLCASIARRHNLVLRDRSSLAPLQIELAAKGDPFVRGVLACVAQFVLLLDQSLDSGQALSDLFLQPVHEEVEGSPVEIAGRAAP